MSSDQKEIIERIFFSNKILFLTAFFIRLSTAFAFLGAYHPDEVSQGLEFAYFIINPSINVRFVSDFYQLQVWNALWPLLLVPFLWFGLQIGLEGLQIYLFMRSLMSLFSLLYLKPVMNMYSDGTEKGAIRGKFAGWMLAIMWPLSFFGVQVMTDGVGLVLFLLAIPLIKRSKENSLDLKQKFFLGLLIGFSGSLRLPLFVIWLPYLIDLAKNREFLIISGIITALVPYMVLDWLFYGFPFISVWNFLEYNVISQKFTSPGGLDPWWEYWLLIPAAFSFFGIIIFGRMVKWAVQSKWNQLEMNSIVIGAILYTLIHLFINHREIRFFLPIIALVVILSSTTAPQLVKQLQRPKAKRFWQIMFIGFFVVNFLILISLPYDRNANLWQAQNYVRKLNPEANVTIMSGNWVTGGYLLQYGSADPGHIEVIFPGVTFSSVEKINMNYVLLDKHSELYLTWYNYFHDNCSDFKFLKVFNHHRLFSLNRFIFYTYEIQVYRCNTSIL